MQRKNLRNVMYRKREIHVSTMQIKGDDGDGDDDDVDVPPLRFL